MPITPLSMDSVNGENAERPAVGHGSLDLMRYVLSLMLNLPLTSLPHQVAVSWVRRQNDKSRRQTDVAMRQRLPADLSATPQRAVPVEASRLKLELQCLLYQKKKGWWHHSHPTTQPEERGSGPGGLTKSPESEELGRAPAKARQTLTTGPTLTLAVSSASSDWAVSAGTD